VNKKCITLQQYGLLLCPDNLKYMRKVLGLSNISKTQFFQVFYKDILTALAVFFFVHPENIFPKIIPKPKINQ